MPRKRLFFVIAVFIFAALSVSAPVFAQQGENQVTHIVQPGENLYRIAVRYGVDMNILARANNITNMQRIYTGQVLVIPGLQAPDSSDEVVNPLVAGTPQVHTVQPGETLTIIARRYGITVEEILQANSIPNPNRIMRGQALNIWTPETVDQAMNEALAAEENAPAEMVQGAAPAANTLYEVQPGEHLALIAQRFGMNWQVLAQANGITDPDRLLAGQRLVIPALNRDGTVNDLGIIIPAVPPAQAQASFNAPQPTITNGKQIIVDLSDSRVYAYEDGRLVYSALASMGLPATPTVQGDFKIYHRLESQTMSGPGYSLPGVQWVQYFYQGYALHGAYWHNNFGQPMSRGCVNLTNEDALWFYNFADYGTSVRVQP